MINVVFQELETERLALTEISMADAPELFILRSQPAVMKYLGKDPMKEPSEAESFIAKMIVDRDEENGINWGIRMKGSDKLIGLISYWRLMKPHWRAEIGYSLMGEYHRKGLMSEALHTVIRYGFDVVKLHSIQAETDPLNLGSRGLLENAGFKLEAHYTEDYYYKGVFSDSTIYSLLERWYKPIQDRKL